MAQNESFDFSKLVTGLVVTVAGFFGLKWAADTQWGKQAIDWIKGLFSKKKEESTPVFPQTPAPVAPPSATSQEQTDTTNRTAQLERNKILLEQEIKGRDTSPVMEATGAITTTAPPTPPRQESTLPPITIDERFFKILKQHPPSDVPKALDYAITHGDAKTKTGAEAVSLVWEGIMAKDYEKKGKLSSVNLARFHRDVDILEAVYFAQGNDITRKNENETYHLTPEGGKLIALLNQKGNESRIKHYAALQLLQDQDILPRITRITPEGQTVAVDADGKEIALNDTNRTDPPPSSTPQKPVITDENIINILKNKPTSSDLNNYLDTSSSSNDTAKMERIFTTWNMIEKNYKNPETPISDPDKKLLIAAAENDTINYAAILSASNRSNTFNDKKFAAHHNAFFQQVAQTLKSTTAETLFTPTPSRSGDVLSPQP